MLGETTSQLSLAFDRDARWPKADLGSVACWFQGYLSDGSQGKTAARTVAGHLEKHLSAGASPDTAKRLLRELDGHFAFAAQGSGWTLAAVDPIRSVPLSFLMSREGTMLGPSAGALAMAGKVSALDEDGVLSFAMSGYTTGRATILKGLHQLMPGEFLFESAGAAPEARTYAAYNPAGRNRDDRDALRNTLAELTLHVLEKVISSAAGRTIVVPLSAGRDSRLIVSGLHHLGVRDVRCYSYGRANNYEAEASRKIADHLGFEWDFVPYTLPQQRETFASDGYRDFMTFSDQMSALPFQQDYHAVQILLDKGFIPADAVLVNGQSGDYISGNHIPAEYSDPTAPADLEARWKRLIDTTIDKHYSHWHVLKTPENLGSLANQLQAELTAAGLEFGDDPTEDFGLFEALEFRNRQAKYVVGGQRVYDYHGLDWRLPLWDRDYMSFWQDVPLTAKRGQNLFAEMLQDQNWAGVWRGWHFPQKISPPALAGLRLFLKALHLPLGRTAWHKFQRQYLDYFMDLLCNYAVVPYGTVARDRRGFRNALSWHTEAYLEGKGVTLDGLSEMPAI